MKKLVLTLLIPLCGYAVTAQTKHKPVTRKTPAKTTAPIRMTSLTDSASYAFGLSMASGLKTNGLKALNYDLLTKGLKDAFQGQTPLLTEQASQKVIGNLFKEITMEKYAAQIAKEKNFLEGNLKVTEVKSTASGLQYIVVAPGDGPKPKLTDQVTVNYKGTLLSGKQFDSSYDRKEPLTIGVDRVIPGWTEGLQLMSPGAKYKFFIPYNLAYGERPMGKEIPPYSMLIFEVELLKVNDK